ncbi:ATP-dependent RNA helicase RhlE [Filimonas lacunae]|uniref:DEAD-box ATP-dependent RNA helicase RhpA n=1 Tax=Filimonas lacunae TaxID=477680 RepID=A0A173MM11_9BACT|nr:DEAD/DEAH box helicase [Filimonas lacunae]BAV08685.1 ATP-dependent RNA helicase RhlE [Filimonas lacunae]SIS59938.1 ATP-dependent RNA helicase RhlE [Filimonas lacunae]
MTFQELNLSESIIKALTEEGYTKPTPIQEEAIPIVLRKKDLLGCAQTGTGKTAAFSLPIIEHLLKDEPSGGYKHIRALILTPTRELAAQIDESISAYTRYTGIKHDVIFGGVSQHTQTLALRNGTDILIATPGRLLDLMNQGYVHIAHLQYFVLDEADRMLDMGFINDIKKIIRELPEERQTLFFSATMPPTIAKLADSLLTDPERVEITPVSTTAEKVKQAVFMVSKNDKPALLEYLLNLGNITRTLVFTRTKHGADKIAKQLTKAGIRADALHGDKSQQSRISALHNFKTGRLRVLVATDIASRGIDVDSLAYVINYDMPEMPETYVHRIGRTGRADKSGIAISFCSREEKENLRLINKVTNQNIPLVADHPFHLKESAHPPGPRGAGGNRGPRQQQGARSGNSNNNRKRPYSGGGNRRASSGSGSGHQHAGRQQGAASKAVE